MAVRLRYCSAYCRGRGKGWPFRWTLFISETPKTFRLGPFWRFFIFFIKLLIDLNSVFIRCRASYGFDNSLENKENLEHIIFELYKENCENYTQVTLPGPKVDFRTCFISTLGSKIGSKLWFSVKLSIKKNFENVLFDAKGVKKVNIFEGVRSFVLMGSFMWLWKCVIFVWSRLATLFDRDIKTSSLINSSRSLCRDNKHNKRRFMHVLLASRYPHYSKWSK